MWTVLILFGMILFFITGWLRADLVALIGLLSLVLTNQLTPGEAMAGFSTSVVLMIAGLFIVGAGLFHYGLAERLASALIPYANGSETRLFYLFMLTVALLSSVMSNTGTVVRGLWSCLGPRRFISGDDGTQSNHLEHRDRYFVHSASHRSIGIHGGQSNPVRHRCRHFSISCFHDTVRFSDKRDGV